MSKENNKKDNKELKERIITLVSREAYFTASDVKSGFVRWGGPFTSREINLALKALVRDGLFTYDPSTRPFVYVPVTNRNISTDDSTSALLLTMKTINTTYYSQSRLEDIKAGCEALIERINSTLNK